MDGLDKLLAPLAVITAASIAGLISLVNLVISKDEKVTDFRQDWINSVRKEIASLISYATTISSMRNIVSATQEWKGKKKL